MIHVKNYETVSKLWTVNCGLVFPDTVYIDWFDVDVVDRIRFMLCVQVYKSTAALAGSPVFNFK